MRLHFLLVGFLLVLSLRFVGFGIEIEIGIGKEVGRRERWMRRRFGRRIGRFRWVVVGIFELVGEGMRCRYHRPVLRRIFLGRFLYGPRERYHEF